MYLRRAIYIGSLVLCYIPKVQGLADLPEQRQRPAAAERELFYSQFRQFTDYRNADAGYNPHGPPAAPGISATVCGNGVVQLHWVVADSAASCSIYKACNAEMPELLRSLSAGEKAAHTDSAVVPGNVYTYYIKASNPVSGYSQWSPAARVSVEAEAVVQFDEIRNDTASHRLYFRWSKPAARVAGYRIVATRRGKPVVLCRVDGETSEVACHYQGVLQGAVFSIEPVFIR